MHDKIHKDKGPKEPRVCCLYASTAFLAIYTTILLFGVLEIILNLSFVGAILIWAGIAGLCGTFSSSITMVTFLIAWSQILLIFSIFTSMVYLLRMAYFAQFDAYNGVIARNDLVPVWTAFCAIHCVLVGIAMFWVFYIMIEYRKYLVALNRRNNKYSAESYHHSTLQAKDRNDTEKMPITGDTTVKETKGNQSQTGSTPTWHPDVPRYNTPEKMSNSSDDEKKQYYSKYRDNQLERQKHQQEVYEKPKSPPKDRPDRHHRQGSDRSASSTSKPKKRSKSVSSRSASGRLNASENEDLPLLR